MHRLPASARRLAAATAFAAVASAVATLLPSVARAQSDPSTAAAATDACVPVEIRNVRAGQGALMVAAYADEAAFVARRPASAVRVPAGDAPSVRVPLCGLAGGPLAVLVFQDLNGNGRMDANACGIPSEPYGSSGRPAPMAAPTWERARVERDAAAGVVVVLSS
jgi:uncharacterized protein (DUF2141 family)